MGRLVVSSLVTLDGVSEDPAGFDGTAHGGWSLPFFDEEVGSSALELLVASDVFLCGRLTYEGFAKFGPAITGAYADRLNSMPKLVASTTLHEPLEWNATLIDGDVIGTVTNLKSQSDTDIVVYGGGALIGALTTANLVDEFKYRWFR